MYIYKPCIIFTLFCLGCAQSNDAQSTEYEIPVRNHDLSYIPFNDNLDDADFVVCDSTGIVSGRNRLQYNGGKRQLRQDIISNYNYRDDYGSFTGYIVIRFIANCKSETGRYRAESLNLDFSPAIAPVGLVEHVRDLIRSLDNWTKSTSHGATAEYSKFINLKMSNGQIQHVIL